MSDRTLDVSLVLKLVDQLTRPAEKADRALVGLREAAKGLDRAEGGERLAGDLKAVSGAAGKAKTDIDQMRQAADRTDDGNGPEQLKLDLNSVANAADLAKSDIDQMRTAADRVDDGSGPENLGSDLKVLSGAADKAKADIDQVRNAADRVDDGRGPEALKSDLDGVAGAAGEAEQRIDRAKAAAERLGRTNVDRFGRSMSGAARPGTRGGLSKAATAMLNRLGADAILPIGSGVAYALGGGVASAALVAGASVKGAASDEFASDQHRVLGEYGKEDQARYDRLMSEIGARKGVGTQGAMGVFSLLMSGGLDAKNASAMTEGAIVFSKATQANPEDSARTTIALKNNMGIGQSDMMAAYDAMALGGKAGQFEVPDMARSFPALAARMKGLGESGMQGVKGLVAMAQAIRKTAGSSDEAATNFENMLDKFTASDFIKNAKDVGINVEKVLKDATKRGVSPVLALIDEIGRKVGNDPFKLSALLPDRQARAGVQAVLTDMSEVRSLIEEMDRSTGTVMNDFATATDNASSAFDRFSSNVVAKTKLLGAQVLPVLTAAMNGLSGAMESRNREPAKIEVPDDAPADLKSAVSSANDRGARLNRFFEGLFGFDKSDASRALDQADAYRTNAESRMAGADAPRPKVPEMSSLVATLEMAQVEDMRKAAAAASSSAAPGDPEARLKANLQQLDTLRKALSDFVSPEAQTAVKGQIEAVMGNLKATAESTDLAPAGREMLQKYAGALAAESDQPLSVARKLADELKALLDITLTPRIVPETGGYPVPRPRPRANGTPSADPIRYEPPSAAPRATRIDYAPPPPDRAAPASAPQRQAAISRPVTVHQTIHQTITGTADAEATGRAAARALDQQTARSFAAALHDLGSTA
ncbi:phage tail tape measure protein, TP901 family, core region [Hartmannibacter diazotrophicus]|uniref:Phage tail tape measure protein, TP901 family, core region n=1 Tax=Hartmannibacter diazotrophicus TaxID=1482074 RepID=A0A2C9D7V7_9HYPH|nr:phage tail tape measure protein [Hartmannibacter diazotrophicus]SON55831.1 phage tail tape measure protein, TP901 family, core region [Hartmannibacter diazotrophicus]